MKKLKTILVAGAALFGAVQAWGVDVSTWATLKSNLEAGNDVKLTQNITQDSDTCYLRNNQQIMLDLNGYTITKATGLWLICPESDGAKLTIEDSKGGGQIVNVSGGSVAQHGGCFVVERGEMILNGGTLSGFVATRNAGCVMVWNNGKFTMNGGTITGCSAQYGGEFYSGGAVYAVGTFTMNGGAIANCTAAGGGGAVFVEGTFTLNGGTITGCSAQYGGGISIGSGTLNLSGGTISGNIGTACAGGVRGTGGTINLSGTRIVGCQANRNGNGVQLSGPCTFNMTGGEVVGCGDCAGSTQDFGGALLFWSGVTANIYGGVIANNSTSGYGAAITFGDTCAGVNIYGGVFSNNVGAATQKLLYRYSGSSTATVWGGVFDANPNTTTSATTVKTVEQVGTKYVVGNYIATDADDQLTGGIYTFCPTNAQYEAAGVAVAPNVTITGSGTSYTLKTTDPVECSTWATLKSNLEAGNDVKLVQDVAQSATDSRVTLATPGMVTLDLNGHTITKSPIRFFAQVCSSGAKLTLTDTSSEKTGKVVQASGTTHSDNGGALRIDAGEVVVNGGTYSGLSCQAKGGFAYVASGGTLTMNGGTITNCTATSGGAIRGESGSAVTLKNGTISGCTANTGGGGGVSIAAQSGTVVIENMTFTGNTSKTGWGGAINTDNEGGAFVLRNCTITGNSAAQSGGAIVVGKDVEVDIYDCTVTGNKSDQGGAIYLNSNSGNKIRIYGIVLANNKRGSSISDFKIDRSGAVTAYGGVYGTNPSGVTNLAIADGCSSTLVGTKYVVGKSIAYDADNQLTAGTYTFCPTNAEYVAAGVEVKEGKFINASTAATPKTWTVSDYETKADPSSTYTPTKIINGGFDTFPWMDYEVDGVRVTQPPSPFRQIENAILYPNGVDGGWNTTETTVSSYTGSSFENYYDVDSSTAMTGTRSDGVRTLGYWTTKGICGNDNLYNKGQNIFIEMNLSHADTLYQDLTTYGGDVIRWSLKHGFRNKGDSDTYQPITTYIGAPLTSSSSIVQPTRDNVNIDSATLGTYTYSGCSGTYAYGNSSELAALRLSSSQADKWYTAQGVYVIPESQSVTRFAFKSNAETANAGNFLDDITFSTLIGNLRALLNDDGSATITGYWGDGDTSKKLMVKIGDDTVDAIDMSGVLNQNFKITVAADKIGSANSLEVYHQDYESAKRTVVIGWPVTLNLNAADATCAKLTEYQRGAVTVLPIPTRRGYAFDGWFTNSVLTGDVATSIPADATGAKEFWAKWESLVQVGDDAWARIKDGVCTISGTGTTWAGAKNPLDAEAITNVVIADGVTGIGSRFFKYFSNLNSVTGGKDLATVGTNAFYLCMSLEDITLDCTEIPAGLSDAIVFQTAIKPEGEAYLIPAISVKGYSQVLYGKKSLDDKTWKNLGSPADRSIYETDGYHFFQIRLVKVN